MRTVQNFSWLKFVDYSKFDKWFVSYYINPNNFDSTFSLVELRNVISPIKNKIRKIDYKKDFPVVKKISFADGVIHLRDELETNMDLYALEKGDLLVSKINFHQGALAINTIGKLVCTTHYQPYHINRDIVNDKYLVMAIRSQNFKNHLSFLRAEGIKNEATYEFISSLLIPLPPLSEQQKIVEAYERKINDAQELQLKAQNLEADIEKYLFEELGIEKNKISIKNDSLLHLVDFKNVEKWGFDYNNKGEDLFFHSNKYKNERLKNLVDINPTTILPDKDTVISFIPMECISDEYGKVVELREKTVLNSKGYTKFQDGDLIWARITPCMQNGKSAIVNNLKNGFGCGSTEYHVLRNSSKSVDLEFIYHILRLPKLLQYATLFFTGSAGQQRVPKAFLEDFIIPVPTLEKQKEISHHISDMKNRIEMLKNEASALKENAEIEFEETVFKTQ